MLVRAEVYHGDVSTGSIVDCRQFIDCGCLGYIVAALSSKSEGVRSAGSHALSRFCTHLEGAKFREKLQVMHLLRYSELCLHWIVCYTWMQTNSLCMYLHTNVYI